VNTFLTFLGCGSSMGVPRADGYWGFCDKKNIKNYRTRCSVLISKGNNNILIDTSPDLRSQLLRNKIKNISSVLYTHKHADQTHGINDLRVFFLKNKKKLNIYADKTTLSYLKNNFSYFFNDGTEYPAILNANKLKSNFSLGSKKELIKFRSIKVRHGKINSIGYIFANTAYISDCNELSNSNLNKLKNLKYFIIDCLRFNPHPSHFSLDEVLDVLKEIKPANTILTNLHSDLDYNILLQKLPINVKPAFDGLKMQL
jgi:phosphoribosyl 1,2-cyclic phosphate phosphodiesterase|tara:strand:+ start:5960 stop:6730 length:771 start_codon:yes stop_codon:yes gene_type:complete